MIKEEDKNSEAAEKPERNRGGELSASEKMIAGKKLWKLPADPLTTVSTYSLAPRESVMAFRLHANVRIRIAGTIENKTVMTFKLRMVS